MRGRARPVRRTDGYVAGLIREVLAEGEVERHELGDRLARLAKGRAHKRNSPQYRLIEQSLEALEAAGEVERRYAPSPYDDDRRLFGKTYFKLRAS